MNQRRPRLWVRRLKRLLLILVGLLLVLFLGLQILFATPWFRGKVAGKLSQRVGLEVSIGGLGWTPWGGGAVREFRVEQPPGIREQTEDPLVQVGEIRVFPDYVACLRGNWRARRVQFDAPELAVSVEMLVAMVGSRVPDAEPPTVALAKPPAAPPRVTPPSGPETVVEPGSEHAVAPPKPVAGQPSAKEEPQAKKQPFELIVSSAKGLLFSAGSKTSICSFSGVDLKLPLGDATKQGGGKIGQISLGDQVIETEVLFEVESPGSLVEFKVMENADKEMQLTGGLRVKLSRGLPFQAVVGYRSSAPIRTSVPGIGEVEVSRNQTAVQGTGFGVAPMSWRGLLQFQGEGIRLPKQSLEMGRYEGSVLLQNGVLQIPDIRFLGDDFSLLGNGWVNRRAGSGVVRLVVPEQAEGVLRGRFGVTELQALEPGDRRFLDVTLWRAPEDWMADVDGRTVPLRELWSYEQR